MTQRDVDLGDAELEVLNVLWKAGPCTVRSVLNELHGRGRELAYTTVLTFLSRLEQKGFVESDKSGLAYVYKPTVTRRRVTRSRLRSLLQQLYDGEAGPLVLELVRHEKLKREDLDELHALIDRLDKKAQ